MTPAVKYLSSRPFGWKMALCILLLCAGKGVQAQGVFFSASVTKGCAPLLVEFTDSTNNSTSWTWDLGDARPPVFGKKVGKLYETPGIYTVKLVVTTAGGKDSLTKVNYIEIYAKPTVNFSATPLTGCAPLPVTFTSSATAGSGTIQSQIWDFGDGKLDTGISPLHAYELPNSYGVTLTVKNTNGCNASLTKPNFVQVRGVKALYDYVFVNTCEPPVTVSFTNQSVSNDNPAYKWSFGDGGRSTQASPLHQYSTAGNYRTVLTATSAGGCVDSIIKDVSVGILQPDFAIPASVCINSPIIFANTSSPDPTSVKWTFGDGGTSDSLQGVHTYTTEGTFPITMTANFANCIRQVTKDIVIVKRPVASFITDGDGRYCDLPPGVQFTNTSIQAKRYLWLFGDGTTATEINPFHSYKAPGKYSVTLIAYNETNCADSFIKTDLIQIVPPNIDSIIGLPVVVCAPAVVTMTPVITSAEPITSYIWDLGDGTSTGTSSVAHTYSNAGSYNVSLIIITRSGCADTLRVNDAVYADARPVVDFSAVRDTCLSRSVPFTDLSTGNIISWRWVFGDGNTSTLQNPTNYYNTAGDFNVSLTVQTRGCSVTVQRNNYVHVNLPIARFSIDRRDCALPYKRVFREGNSPGNNGVYFWQFGDDSTSTIQHPTHIYTKPGLYIVSLTVTDGNGCFDTRVDTVNIIDMHPSLTFSLGTDFCKKQTGIFTAGDYDPTLTQSFRWFFGDNMGTFGGLDSASVSHIYKDTGSFMPYLIVQDILQCFDTVRQTVPYHVYGPKAAFTNAAGTCISSGQIDFTSTSTTDNVHPITNWDWAYGDGTTGTYTIPTATHNYDSTASFAVRLAVTDSYGCTDTVIRSAAVIITNPKAAFTFSDSLKCTKNNILFTNRSSGSPVLNYQWSFGDATTSVAASPNHFYATEGLYSVKLVVRDNYGCSDSIMKTDIITISDPNASFILTDTFVSCPPLIIGPTNTSTNAVSYTWDFKDGNISALKNPTHYYTMGGNYNLALIVKGYGNCADTAYQKLVVTGPSGTLTYTTVPGCNPVLVNFNATSKDAAYAVWDLNDGTTTATLAPTLSHTYTSSGNYVPKVLLTDNADCKVTVTGLDTIRVAQVKARVVQLVDKFCDSTKISLLDSSVIDNDVVNNYLWTLKNNRTSSQQNVIQTFTASDSYTAQLVITSNSGCTDTVRQLVTATINSSPEVRISSADSICVASGLTLNAGDNRNNNITSWKWDFGDGNSSTDKTTTHTYLGSGTYTASVTAVDDNGCTDTETKTLFAVALPPVYAGRDTTICLGDTILLRPTGAYSYVWNTDTTLGCTSCERPPAHPHTTTMYKVTGRNFFGCASEDSVQLKLKMPLSISLFGKDTICIGESTTLFTTRAELYTWSPATGLSDIHAGNPVATPSITTTYRVTATDTLSCFSDTKEITVRVYPIPVFRIIDSVITVSGGSTVKLRTESSADITKWRWTPTSYLDCTDCPEPLTKPKNNIIYFVTASNDGNCQVSDNVRVLVTCNGSNIFMPNTFSPNGDGMNDVFYPRGAGLFRIRSLKVFNRQGQLIFESREFAANDAVKGWNGTFGGQPAPADVYVYTMEVVCENNTVLTSQGNVSLLR